MSFNDFWKNERERKTGLRMKHAWAYWAYEQGIISLNERNRMLD